MNMKENKSSKITRKRQMLLIRSCVKNMNCAWDRNTSAYKLGLGMQLASLKSKRYNT